MILELPNPRRRRRLPSVVLPDLHSASGERGLTKEGKETHSSGQPQNTEYEIRNSAVGNLKFGAWNFTEVWSLKFGVSPCALRPSQQGVALVITLILLSVITFMAVVFLVVSR